MAKQPMPAALAVICVLGLLMGLPPIATDMYLPAMPAIAVSLNAGPEAVQQTLTLFLLFFSIAQLVFGPLSDAYGRQKIVVTGLVVFALGSALCASAKSIEALIFYRGLQGIGGAAVIVTVPAVVRDHVSGSGFSRMMGFIMLVMGIAPLVAPLLGSVIIGFVSWRYIFVWLASVALIAAALYVYHVGETHPEHLRTRFSPQNVWANYGAVLKDRQALCYMLCSAFAIAAMFGFLAASPFIYIERYHVSAHGYAGLFMANVVLMLLVTSISNRFVIKHGPRRMLTMAMTMIAFSSAIFAVVALLQEPPLLLIVAGVMLFIGTAGVVNANAMALVLTRLGAISGSASAVAGSLRFGLGSLAPVAIGFIYDGSAQPMALVMLICGIASISFYYLAGRLNPA